MKEYRVFYSKDCMMYGVEKKVTKYGNTFWQQVLPPSGKGGRSGKSGKSAYTYYKGVAERWLKELTA